MQVGRQPSSPLQTILGAKWDALSVQICVYSFHIQDLQTHPTGVHMQSMDARVLGTFTKQ